MKSIRSAVPAALDNAILHTVIYADVFDYPLHADEIHRYLTGVSASPESVAAGLECLVPTGLQRSGEAYFLPGRDEIVARRMRREQIALSLWPQAVRYGHIIAGLPFVRMVAVTGSLAMNNVEADADLDYLIVTAAGRLWLCRALILAIGRLASLRRARICPNYLISECALEFPEHTLYAAHELAQMVPLAGRQVYRRIRESNPWVGHFLPNAGDAPNYTDADELGGTAAKAKSVLERVLLSSVGTRLENWEMQRKIRKLRAENEANPEASFSPDTCKGHSNRHGYRTERILDEKLQQFSLGVGG